MALTGLIAAHRSLQIFLISWKCYIWCKRCKNCIDQFLHYTTQSKFESWVRASCIEMLTMNFSLSCKQKSARSHSEPHYFNKLVIFLLSQNPDLNNVNWYDLCQNHFVLFVVDSLCDSLCVKSFVYSSLCNFIWDVFRFLFRS